MKPIVHIKIAVDCLMILLLPILMAYMLVGEAAHEYLGTIMVLLFLVHVSLNRKWYRSIAKGRYSPFRILQTIINVLLTLVMLGLMTSGIMLSKHAFVFLDIQQGMAFARTLHMLCAYWGFAIMSMHLGTHWNMIRSLARRRRVCDGKTPEQTSVLRILGITIIVYGVYACMKTDVLSYMTLRTTFVFFDFEQPLPLFFLDYLAMLGMWATAGHHVSNWISKRPGQASPFTKA